MGVTEDPGGSSVHESLRFTPVDKFGDAPDGTVSEFLETHRDSELADLGQDEDGNIDPSMLIFEHDEHGKWCILHEDGGPRVYR